MLDETLKFYRLTCNTAAPPAPTVDEQAPLTHAQVFYKEYPRFETIELPETPRAAISLEGGWDARRSRRAFASQPLALTDVSSLLGANRILDDERETERRTYPSAGARFPIECYLLAFRVEGLDVGCYHYKTRTHELEVLWPAELHAKADEIVSPFVSDPAIAIVMTSVISRAEVKYGYKAYPFSYLEAGHMAQNLLLAASGAGIDACPVGGFVDQTLIDLLDLTGDEVPVYVVAAGR